MLEQYSRDFAAITWTGSLHPAAPTLHDRHQSAAGGLAVGQLARGHCWLLARSEAVAGLSQRPRALQVRIPACYCTRLHVEQYAKHATHRLPTVQPQRCICCIAAALHLLDIAANIARPAYSPCPGRLPSTPRSALKQQKLHDHVPGSSSTLHTGNLTGIASPPAAGHGLPVRTFPPLPRPAVFSAAARIPVAFLLSDHCYPVLSH